MPEVKRRAMALFSAIAACLSAATAAEAPTANAGDDATPWHFAVSGDSRNCGAVVMPSIAAEARAGGAAFYWHLGDIRAIYDFDEDFHALRPKASIAEYLTSAWQQFQRDQIAPFGTMPFYIGIGNHETIPPKTRDEFLITFADWLDAPAIREQRLKDDPADHDLRTYYHWLWQGVDFITLDNATPEQFSAAQRKWLAGVLGRDQRDPRVRALVVGMHEALPESLARGHSMSDFPDAEASGLEVYRELLETRRVKPVYVLASHSHFVMEGIFDTPYWREHGGVLPGWIVGAAGAVRYPLPPDAPRDSVARTNVYGYLLATVRPHGGNDNDPISFEFREVTESTVPAEVAERFGAELVHHCYQENAQN
jgi:hypothetical protein